MNQDDRTHTTSWDAQQVQQAQSQRKASPEPAAPAPKKKKKKKRVKRKMNFFLSLVLWVVFVCAASAILAGVGWMWCNDVTALNKQPLEAEVTIDESWTTTKTVKNEDGATEEITVYDIEKVAAELKEKGLIEYEWLFRVFSWVYKSDEKVGAGTYTLNTNMDYMALVRGMRPSTIQEVETVTLSIPEGYNVQQIIQLLAENGVASVEELTDAAANYQFQDYAFIREDLLGSATRLEGYLFPDTYEFYVGANPVSALDSMLSNFNTKIYNNADLADYLGESEYDLEDIIIIASLIEKETDGSDRSKISSVIYNRLHNAAETAYFLQIDAALVYAAGREITQDDYASLDSPYNLYTHTGLPPTAIANPGLASITAALQPADTDYYFYVLGPDGKHIFNETMAGHQSTIASLG